MAALRLKEGERLVWLGGRHHIAYDTLGRSMTLCGRDKDGASTWTEERPTHIDVNALCVRCHRYHDSPYNGAATEREIQQMVQAAKGQQQP